MNLGLKDKVAAITGGSAGIGYATAQLLLEEGAYVTIAGRDEEKLKKAVENLSKINGPDHIKAIAADCFTEKGIEALGQAAAKDGKIDIWVNNVGTNKLRKGETYSEEELDFLIAANFKSAVFGSQTAYTYMKKNGGSIVNVASLAARCASCGRATLYGALKSGVVGLTNTTAGEYAAYGIRVNAVLPGFTITDLTKNSVMRENEKNGQLDRSLQNNLMRRMAQPTEIANAIVFLSSEAASYITAESIEVSGGHSRVLNAWYSYENKED